MVEAHVNAKRSTATGAPPTLRRSPREVKAERTTNDNADCIRLLATVVDEEEEEEEDEEEEEHFRCLIDTSTPETLERDFYAWLTGSLGNEKFSFHSSTANSSAPYNNNNNNNVVSDQRGLCWDHSPADEFDDCMRREETVASAGRCPPPSTVLADGACDAGGSCSDYGGAAFLPSVYNIVQAATASVARSASALSSASSSSASNYYNSSCDVSPQMDPYQHSAYFDPSDILPASMCGSDLATSVPPQQHHHQQQQTGSYYANPFSVVVAQQRNADYGLAGVGCLIVDEPANCQLESGGGGRTPMKKRYGKSSASAAAHSPWMDGSANGAVLVKSSGTNQLGRHYSPGLPLSMCERERIVVLYRCGWKICDISKRLCVTHSCVSKILHRFRTTGSWRPKDAKEGRQESPLVAAIRDYRFRLGMTRQSEIREQLIRDGVCRRENAPSRSSINHILRTKLDLKRRKK